MNFDFSALNFETIDSNINAYPDMFLNQNGVTFTKKVLEDLGYPAYVLCLLDAKARVFAIRSCKSNEPKGFKFSKPRGEQKRKVNSTQAVLSSKKAPKHDKKEAQHRAVWRDAGLRVQFHSSARRKSRIFRCLIPFRLMSNSSRETTYFGKLSRMLSYAPNSRLTVSSEASR